MLIIDDLFMMLFDNIADHVNKQYLEYLMDYLKRLTLTYERGLLNRETFEAQKAKVLRTVEAYSLQLERRRGRGRGLELRL